MPSNSVRAWDEQDYTSSAVFHSERPSLTGPIACSGPAKQVIYRTSREAGEAAKDWLLRVAPAGGVARPTAS